MLLESLSKKYGADKMDHELTMHFLDVYEHHFSAIREAPMNILEIGIHRGGSLKMWADYFPASQITGVDVDGECRKYGSERITVIIGDQADETFLNSLGRFDIIIDDGGHTMVQQQKSLEVLWEHLNPKGVYVLEDLETSYWPKFGGGYERLDTTIDLLKSRVENLNHRAIGHSRAEKDRKTVTDYHIKSIHFYPSMCFLYKE